MPRLFEATAADAAKYRGELLQQIPGAKMGTHWDLNYQVLPVTACRRRHFAPRLKQTLIKCQPTAA